MWLAKIGIKRSEVKCKIIDRPTCYSRRHEVTTYYVYARASIIKMTPTAIL